MDEGKGICQKCGCSFDEPDWVDASIDLGELGVKPEWIAVCPYCGSEDFLPAHDCANNCGNFAEEDKELCDECFGKLIKKYISFVDSLTPAEQDALNALTEDVYVCDFKEALRRSGEWLDSRL
jgi:RNA polymerase subunit RPABC4/transcription elongation factor Spt4